jgi:hypothetical protein
MHTFEVKYGRSFKIVVPAFFSQKIYVVLNILALPRMIKKTVTIAIFKPRNWGISQI